jgi:hypothetical protein
MDIQFVCQSLLVVQLVFTFFYAVHGDFHDRKKQAAQGFFGFLMTCLVIALMSLVYYGAGAFSQFLPAIQ